MTNLTPIKDKRQGFAALFLRSPWLLLVACLWLVNSSAQAAQWQPHEDIYQAVNQFSQRQLGGHATTNKLDERSRYPLCKSPLQVTLPFNNHKTVKVVCQKTHSTKKSNWSLYLSISVQTNTQAWRLISPMAVQSTIQAGDVALMTYTGSQSNFMGSESNPVGQKVKRRLSAGHWLSPIDMSDLQSLWRAAEDIPQGQIITLKHLTGSQESAKTASPNAITNKAHLLGQLARRYIKAGKLLDKNDIEGRQLVVISSQALDMGRELIDQDLSMEWVPDHKLRQAGFNAKDGIVGWVTKRHIASQTPLTQDMLRPAYLVLKDSQVSLQINVGNYQITNQGQALSNGNLGDKIEVKVSPSGLVKQGLVIAKGQVELSR
jgi:flagella basal body P-ring formation protein FlgA